MDRWTDPSFITDATAWPRERCATLGLSITGAIAPPHVAPWSTVFRIPTDRGDVYLKACGPSQVHEPGLTELPARAWPDCVPELLAADRERAWMLLADGGPTLRATLGGRPGYAEWERILPRYAEIQIGLASRSDELLALGVPDLRLSKLADLYASLLLLLDADALLIGMPDGLTTEQAERARRLVPTVRERCAELASCGSAPRSSTRICTPGTSSRARAGTPSTTGMTPASRTLSRPSP